MFPFIFSLSKNYEDIVTLLFGTVCVTVFIAAFMGRRFCIFLDPQRIFMESGQFIFFAITFIEIISGPGIVCGPVQLLKVTSIYLCQNRGKKLMS